MLFVLGTTCATILCCSSSFVALLLIVSLSLSPPPIRKQHYSHTEVFSEEREGEIPLQLLTGTLSLLKADPCCVNPAMPIGKCEAMGHSLHTL